MMSNVKMTSIVTDILSSAGKLNKMSVNAKVKELEGKVKDLKEKALNELGSWYQRFTPMDNDAMNLSKEVVAVLSEVTDLNEQVDKQLKQQLTETVSEVKDLREEIVEMQVVLGAVRELVCIHEGLASVDQHIKDSNHKHAWDAINNVESIISKRRVEERAVPILVKMKEQVVLQKERIRYNLDETWKNNVAFQDHGRLVITDPATIKTVIEEMEHFGKLENRLKLFGARCLKLLFVPLLFDAQLDICDGDDSVQIIVTKETSQDVVAPPGVVFKSFRCILSALLNCFMSHQLSNGVTVMRHFGDTIGSELCELIIEKTLAPAVPSDNKNLEAFKDVQTQTERFQEFLWHIEFLPENKKTIISYARNVDMLFLNKRCQAILKTAREYMYKPLHDTVLVESKEQSDPLLELRASVEEGHLRPKHQLHQSFDFPTCQISSSSKDITKLITDVLEEATQTEAMCAARLYTTVRNVFSIYCKVVPVYHKESLQLLPQQSALCHNNCMYLSHTVLSLVQDYQNKLPSPLNLQPISLMDVFQELRVVAMDVFRQQMQLQKNQLVQICRDAGGFQQVASNPSLVSASEKSVKQCLHQLQLLQKVWQPVLPVTVYYKSIGLLINSLIGELVSEIVCLEDIPADSALQIISVLSVLTTNVPQLFSAEETGSTLKALVMRSVRNWGRLEELVIVLGASMRDIEDRWASGKGPLAAHFSVDDTKHLIRALFRNTDRRAKVLARITC